MKAKQKDPNLIIDKELVAIFENRWAEMSNQELADETMKYVEKVLEAQKAHAILIKELGISREKLERETALMTLCMRADNKRTPI